MSLLTMQVFLSYNREDSEAVEEVARGLRRDGIEPWFDRWSAAPGQAWQVQIAEALGAVSACAVFVGPHGLGGWAREELAVAQDRVSRDRGFRLFMVLLPGATDPQDPALAFLSQRTWVDLRQGIRTADGHRELLMAITGLPLREEVIEPREGDACPYRGLAAFDRDDAEFFFGRTDDARRLVERIRAARFLAVLGSSGSGKSSLVRAGLVPALEAGGLRGSERWPIRIFTPGERPLHTLAAQLAGLGGGDSMNRTLDAMRADERSLDLAVSLALAGDRAPERLLLVVDQLEEIFTLCRNEGERARFLNAVRYAATIPGGKLVVVLAMRADFYERCASYPQLASLINGNQFLVGPLDRAGLREAIEEPAWRAGLIVEPGLSETILNDVGDRPGALPLLQHVLLEVWRRRRGDMLTLEGYEASGRVAGALAKRADEIYGSLTADQQRIARQVLMRLVQPGDHTEDTRRRAPLGELTAVPATSRDVEAVIDAMADSRQLVTSRDPSTGARQVEITHEALIRGWPRLRAWIDSDREALREHRRLTQAAAEWAAAGRDPNDGALYRGTRLTEAVESRDARAQSLNELEREFLAASEASRARDRATRRRRIRLTGAAVATLAAAVVAIVVTVLFAGRERDIAASRDLATKSSTLIATDPGLALAIALDALRRSDTEQAQNALRKATLAHRATRVITAHDGLAFGVAPSSDGRFAATAGGDRTVRIWNVRSGLRVGEIRGYRDEVRAVSFSHDGKRLASATRDGEIAVAAADGGPRDVVTRLKRDFAASIDFSADGKTVAIGTDGGRVALVRLRDRAVRDLSSGPASPIYAVDFDSDARRVVSAHDDGVARIWNVAGGRPLELAHGGAVVAASFSPDGARMATAGLSGAVLLWDANSGRGPTRIPISEKPLASVRFSGDGRRIVTSGYDGVIHLLAVPGGAVLAELRGHQGPVRADFVPHSGALVSAGEEDGTLRTWIPPATRLPTRPGTGPLFSRDGRLVVSGDVTGPIHVWNPATGKDREFPGHKDASIPQFSPNGRQIVSASFDDRVRLWDVKSGRSYAIPTLKGGKNAAAIDATGDRIAIGGSTPLVIQAPDGSARLRLRGHRGYVNALVFSPDGKHLLTGSDDGTARIWNARSGTLERTLRGHEGIVRGVSYSDDGQSIATAGSDGTARVWPADGGDAAILVGHEGPVNTATFDGRGDRLVTAGDDGTIRIWDATGGDALVVLYQHKGIASGADFSGDGGSVVSAGNDGMRITPCEVCGPLEDALRVARTRAQHKLSAAERQRLLPGG